MRIIHQYDQMDCGPACLAMITQYYGKKFSIQYLRDYCFLTKEGVSLLGISQGANKLHMENFSAKATIQELIHYKNSLPCILYWNQNHFVVLYQIKKKMFSSKRIYKIADPGYGKISLTETQFLSSWATNDRGIALFIEPTAKFFELKVPKKQNKYKLSFLFKYLLPYKKELYQLFMGLTVSSLLTLIFPFLSQALIDKGIGNKSINIIYIILLAQIFLFVGNSVIEVIRNWISLYVGARINLRIISDFLKKIMQLPLKFFDTKMIGDFTQRIGDHERIEKFLTSQSIFTFFSLINLSVFLIVLAIYDIKILLVYFSLTLISVIWMLYFLKRRKVFDYQSFKLRSQNQDSVYELISGMQEIKLNRFENYKREQWESIQIELFSINQKILHLDQYQGIGFNFINHLKNILVTFIAANEVIKGDITLGSMLSISYIIGQMNSPINQLTGFVKSLQDAGISLDRLEEVHKEDDEEKFNQIRVNRDNLNESKGFKKGIRLDKLSFQYEGPKSPYALKDISLYIPEGKVTAIVGASGSGKTTLMKILLKFYPLKQGQIYLNKYDLADISAISWREYCGTVLQDGYIFSDTIERNIATGDALIDDYKMEQALKIANLQGFIDNLPLGLKSKIGSSGSGISGGQKQRILIARAVYKNPDFLFFDEATSALDAENERIIMDNLDEFIKGRTSLIIAHRLSTVKNADQIIVLKNGEITEIGEHSSLVSEKGDYFNLVKNQLELGA